jgi:hypothetical protein
MDTASMNTEPPIPDRQPVAKPAVPLEQRPIAEMSFGFNKCVPDAALPAMTSKTWEPSPEQVTEQVWVRDYLKACGCSVAGDIEKLGCTGVAAYEVGLNVASHETAVNNAISLGRRLRLGLAGSGVGLPCFVPSSRFCLLHNTIGGLEDGQVQHSPAFVGHISRQLTPKEEAKTKVMQHARKLKSVGEVTDFIAGRTPFEDVTEEEDEEPEVPITRLGAPTWKCTEHASTVWSCRYCLAQAIVEGPLEPVLALSSGLGVVEATGQVLSTRVPCADIDAHLVEIGKPPADDVAELFVRAAKFTRKLSRD